MMYAESLLPTLETLARRAAEPLGVEVAWVEFKREGPGWFLRVFIDRDDGVDLKDCERVSERLGLLLDVEDPIESSYTLEVSTPGLDRPLFGRRDYERFTGHLARITTRAPFEGRRRFVGRLAGLDGDVVHLEGADGSWDIPLASIEKGRLEAEIFFSPSRAPRPRMKKR